MTGRLENGRGGDQDNLFALMRDFEVDPGPKARSALVSGLLRSAMRHLADCDFQSEEQSREAVSQSSEAHHTASDQDGQGQE